MKRLSGEFYFTLPPGIYRVLTDHFSRYKEGNEVFFVQNAGSADAGTGLNKSSIIEKVDLAEVAAVSNLTDAVGRVKVHTVPSSPMVINPNG